MYILEVWMSMDRQVLVAGNARLIEAATRDFEKLNDADGALGDGDPGITLNANGACFRNRRRLA